MRWLFLLVWFLYFYTYTYIASFRFSIYGHFLAKSLVYVLFYGYWTKLLNFLNAKNSVECPARFCTELNSYVSCVSIISSARIFLMCLELGSALVVATYYMQYYIQLIVAVNFAYTIKLSAYQMRMPFKCLILFIGVKFVPMKHWCF